MKKSMLTSFIMAIIIFSNGYLFGQAVQKNVEHVKVYYEKGMYGGWPANYGIWIWGDEILVGFSKRHYKDLGPEKHNYDKEKPVENLFARSLNGGKSWKIEDPARMKGIVPYADPVIVSGTDFTQLKSRKLIERVNFTHPDFALTMRSNDNSSRYYYSYNRGHKWNGPFDLPNFGAPSSWARTDYLVEGQDECTMFITISKADNEEGRVICVRTSDGGKTWSRISSVGPEPEGFSIMPASVRISKNELLVVVRRREKDRRFISTYSSPDNGKTWSQLGDAAESTGIGNPPALVKMKDGRICLIYGFRSDVKGILAGTKTSDIRTKISADNGKTWSRDYILRNDGSGQDIGYPRVVQRNDGKIVALYYFMDNKTGRERYIAASIWAPPTNLEY